MPNIFMTGCASGIGRHLTGVFGAAGYRVIATDIDSAALEARKREDEWPDAVELMALDVRDAAAWDSVFAEAVRRVRQFHIVMNIAGCLRARWSHEAPEEDIHDQIDINAKGVIFGTQCAARHMISFGEGHIVNFASMAGLAPIPGIAVYTASKYAVRGYSLATAVELRPLGVHVTVVCPDGVNTPLLDSPLHCEEGALVFSGPKLLTVEDVADVVLNRVLPKKPLEVYIPLSRGLLARLGDLFPRQAQMLLPGLRKRGRATQARLQADQERPL